jgi:hypothetical protein
VALESDYRLTIVESQGQPSQPRSQLRKPATAPATRKLSPHEAVAALRATRGADEVIAQVPNLADPAQLQEIAFFSVCSKTGSAQALDLWDVDHFDGFTDMQSSLNGCRAWFSDGFSFFEAPQRKTGRVSCSFIATVAGTYLAIASLSSGPGSGADSGSARYILDDFGAESPAKRLGDFTFTGPVNHVFVLSLDTSQSVHHFRIDQLAGGFFFLGVTIFLVV